MSECVKVIVRCRPMNGKEKNLSCAKILTIDPNILQVGITKPRLLGSEAAAGKTASEKPSSDAADYEPKRFTFDGVYDDDSTQKEVYEDTAYPLLTSVFDGYNGTIFAYGQTGCGKTFTMEGVRGVAELRGIIPTTFAQVFALMSSNAGPGKQFLVRASYIEIYNEEVRDLTSDNPKARCEVKEDKDKGVYIKGLQNLEVHTEADLEAVMAKGNSNRTVGATLMNADSSRSHSIFCITIETSEPDTVKGADEVRIKQGKLNLVDLAGSERQGKTQAEGVRLKEATKINLSLSALGNVIEALVANAGGKQRHIPYRDSKLTRLLQDSLGGNTKTVMIAAVSPADYNYDETLSTLRYANRAKNIKNKPKVNEDPKDALLKEYQDEIKQLKLILHNQGLGDLLAGLKMGGGGGGVPATPSGKTAAAASKAAVVAVITGKGQVKAAELEEELERLEEEKAKHERMAAVIELELQQQQTEQVGRQEDLSLIDARIQQEEAQGTVEVVELLKAEKDRLLTEERAATLDAQKTHSLMEEEKATHQQAIGQLEAEMKAALIAEEKRRQAIEEKLTFMTQQSDAEKEALQAKLQQLQQKLSSGSADPAQGPQTARDKETRALREAELSLKRRQAELEEERQRKEEQTLFMEEQYSSIQEENAAVRRKLKQIARKYRALEADVDSLQEQVEEGRVAHARDVRASDRQVRLYQQICQAILTATDLDRIVAHSTWQEGREEWKLPNIDLPLVFPTIHTTTHTTQAKPTTADIFADAPAWRRRLSLTKPPSEPPTPNTWRERLQHPPTTSDSKYYNLGTGGRSEGGWGRRNLIAQLSTEQLQMMAKARKPAPPAVSAEEALQRSRVMSEQIHAITAQVKRRETFIPAKVAEESKEEAKDAVAVLEAADGVVRKRPAFTPAKIITTPSHGGGGGGGGGLLPESAFAVPVRPAFSPAAPTSPMSPQSAGVDLSNLPKGRPAFTPAKR